MYRGSRAVLASVTCRTDPARLSFLATSDAQSGFSSTTEFASAIFSPMGFVNELIYREKRSRELEEITLLDGRERERQLFHSLTLQVVQLHNQKRRKHKEGWSKPRAGTKLRQGLLPEPPWIDTEPPRPSCRSASTIKQVPRYFNLRFQQFDTRASVAELRWTITR